MNRWMYLGSTGVLVVLLAYLFWPKSLLGDSVSLWSGERPQDFTVLDPRWKQEIAGSSIRIAGFDRSINPMAVGTLWRTLDGMKVGRANIKEGVVSDELVDYGIDQQHGIDAGPWLLRWGVKEGQGYLWDGRRILAVPAEQVAGLQHAAQRLDDPALVADPSGIRDLSVDQQRFLAGTGGWQEADVPPRPELDRHIGQLISQLAGLQLKVLDAPPATGEVVHRLQFPDAKGKLHELSLRAAGDGLLACYDAYPAQALGAGERSRWQVVIDALHRDYLLALDGDAARAQVKALSVERGGSPWFSAERRQLAYRPGETSWELSWSDGRETASEPAVARILSMLCDVHVVHALGGPDPSPDDPFSLAVVLTMQGGEQVALHLDGDRAWTAAFHGRMAPPSPVEDIQPADLLELNLLDAAPERICKLQRIAASPPLHEVLVRSEDGSWSRSVGSGPVDAVAIGRLAHALTESQAISARLLTEQDRAGMRAPALELDIRLSPRSAGAPRMEISDDRDTVPQDRGFACYQDGKLWRAVDVEGGVSYQLADDLVELLRTPLQSDQVMPLVPSLVSRLEIQRTGSLLVLEREGEEWWLSGQEASTALPRQAADPTQVRRYLRLLAGLTATSRQGDAPTLLPGESSLSVVAFMPSSPGLESIALCLQEHGAVDADASVTASRPATPVPPGRVRLATDAVRDLLQVGPERFARASTPAPARP